jgi:hypothetical protein
MKKSITYLFIGGYLGEVLRKPFVFSYFKDMEELIKEKNQYCRTEFIQNPYNKDIEAGAKLINEKVREICILKNEELIIVGHSRGSLELLHFLNTYRIMGTSSNIKKIIFSSPLFGKSDIANLLSKPLSRVLPKSLINPLKEVSSEKVERDVISIWSEIKHLYAKKCLIIKTSSHNTKHFPFFLKITHNIISRQSGENDGVLALSSQISLHNVEEAHFYSNHGAIFCNKRINLNKQVDILDIFDLLDCPDVLKSHSKKSSTYSNLLYFDPRQRVNHV